jgi:hypothetical protein
MDLDCGGQIFRDHRPFQKPLDPHVVRFAATPIVHFFWRNLHAPDAFHLNEARHGSVRLCHPANLQGGRVFSRRVSCGEQLFTWGGDHARKKKVRLWNR